MTSLREIGRTAEKLISDNSPAILTAIGVVGTVSTALLTGRAAVRASEIVAQERTHRILSNTNPSEIAWPKITEREIVEMTWQEYIPPVIAGGLTISAIILANRIGTRRAAAMAAAYSLSEKAYSEYKDKVVEHLGKNKEQKVRDEIQQDRMVKQPTGSQDIFGTGNGSDLCFEKLTGRYFYSSMENVKHAQNRVNHDIAKGVYASLSDFYDYLGLPHTGISDELGWNGDHLMEIQFSTTMADNNAPCIAFEYRVEPVRNYFRVH